MSPDQLSSQHYELIDFGEGRKLESVAGHIIDRPCPAARQATRQIPAAWHNVEARFDPTDKTWTHYRAWPVDLAIDCGAFRMPVSPTPFGHIGVFPEQSIHWRWLADLPPDHGARRQALNLFAYTGASTLALVAAGFGVAHVDAAKPNVQAARNAAMYNGWSDAPIRFLVDDAEKFSAREVRRGRRYHTIVIDPPTYGHSPRGKAWRIERDLPPLLVNCTQLLDPQSFRLLVTGHSADGGPEHVLGILRECGFLDSAQASAGLRVETGRSQLEDASKRMLDAGYFVRLASPPHQTHP